MTLNVGSHSTSSVHDGICDMPIQQCECDDFIQESDAVENVKESSMR